MTQTLYLNPANPEDMKRAASLLREGQIVAFPTETVYGLGANALCEEAVQGIYRVKQRPTTNPLIIHAADQAEAASLFDFDASQFGNMFRERFEALSQRFWPGPLTLVGTKAAIVSTRVTGGLPKVAVRVPAHPVALELLRLSKVPIAAPSANLYTRPSPTTRHHVSRNLDQQIAAIVDGGQCDFGIESTVIDIDAEKPKILRHGVVSASQIASILPDLIANVVGGSKGEGDASPGLCKRHYAPQLARVSLAHTSEIAKAWFSNGAVILRARSHEVLKNSLGERPASAGPTRVLADDPKGFARELFAAFYDMEAIGPQSLVVEDLTSLQTDPEWASVCDKLLRATSVA